MTTLISTMNCFGNQFECGMEPSLNVQRHNLPLIDDDLEKQFSKTGAYSLYQVGPRIAIIIQDVGSGLYVYSMRIYVKVEKEWQLVKCSRMSTANPQQSPAKVTLNDHVVTISTRDNQVIDRFDVSRYLK